MRLTRLFLVVLAIVMAMTGCAVPFFPTKTQGGGVFVVALDSPVLTLDPANITELSSARVAAQVYETLVEFNAETGAFDPLLAQAWAVSGDGRVWTFTLRSGVLFHDGTPLTAAAVVENFNRWMDVGHPYHHGDFDYWQLLFGGFKGSGSIVRSVERVDDLRFRLTLEQPWSPLLSALAMFPFAIISPTAMHRDVDALRRQPVGTGAFRLSGWAGENEIVLLPNTQYWGGQPKLAGVRFQVMADGAERLSALRNGKVHLVEGSDAAAVTTMRTLTSIKAMLRPSNSVVFLSLNQKMEPFADSRARQAVAYAINRRTIIEKAYGGVAQIADSFIPPIMSRREPADLYDTATARRLLNEAGLGGGTMTQLWYPARPRPLLPNPRALAEAIAADLRAVGIVVSLNAADWPTYQRRSLEGEYPAYLQTWIGDTPDPDAYITPLFATDVAGRSIGYNNPELKTLLAGARSEPDDTRRADAYKQSSGLVRNDMPRVPLVHPQVSVLLAGSVKGFVPSALGVESYRNVSFGAK